MGIFLGASSRCCSAIMPFRQEVGQELRFINVRDMF
jgi:hypothetical protein